MKDDKLNYRYDFKSCSICGSSDGVTKFKRGYICNDCIGVINNYKTTKEKNTSKKI